MKPKLTNGQIYGLTAEEQGIAQRYLRKQGNKKISLDADTLDQMLDLFLMGYPFYLIQREYPQFTLDEIVFSAAIGQWHKKRELVLNSTHEKMRAKVASSMVNQIEFLSLLLQASNVESVQQLKNYINDPVNNPKPSFSINSILSISIPPSIA
jgi:hypothetical protein